MSVSSTTDPLDGITGELASNGDAFKLVLLFFMAISCYNVAELVVLVLSTFRRWKGLYFWSLLLSGCAGVAPYTLGFILKFFTKADSTLSVTILTIGWWIMVTGQAVVLYSRLHLVICDDRILRRVLYMIIANVFLLHVPTTVLTYGSNVVHRKAAYVIGYNIMEKLQMTGFTIQEIVLSGLYVWETVKLLQLCFVRENQRIMRQLVWINVAMLVMDLLLLGLEYASYYAVQITLKGAIYSIKLKLEFAVLGRLVAVVQNRRPISIDGDIALGSFEHEAASGPDRSIGSAGESVSSRTPCCLSAARFANETHRDINVGNGKIVTMTELSAWVDRSNDDHC
ncbi:hypothetical protein ASPCADRAFT_171264 [Aspergillus carbonarius ITEM 5010]|uniref:DUF7703 domain-containing protein n=1 Tax=Aspergillus carbonarius (strain ITEM 5010) TaxID=602072 RepID=A0A1R3RKA1_ASPC5|nr:hypothetical protein ASPCADRAFT_171264 [Aspergillus carbonarius ITEM 5010]